jgi:hypothetical protein
MTTTTTDIRSVAERLEQAGNLDVSKVHAKLQRGMRAIADSVFAELPITPHAAAAKYREYTSPDGAMVGNLRAGTGPKLDWAIDSFIASTKFGFCNHHLTLWADATIDVPHLALAIGTIPQLFFFCDLVPRSDLWVNTEELDTYHARFNDRAVEVAADASFRPFVSREIYIREAISPVGLCLQSEATEANFDRALVWAQETASQWVQWVKAAKPVPEAKREALAARDELVRKTICWRDPANIVAERVLGKAMTDNLVRVLSGEARRS